MTFLTLDGLFPLPCWTKNSELESLCPSPEPHNKPWLSLGQVLPTQLVPTLLSTDASMSQLDTCVHTLPGALAWNHSNTKRKCHPKSKFLLSCHHQALGRFHYLLTFLPE